MKKIAIIGGGFAGLTAAYELSKSGHEVWIFEKNAVSGGAAGGFRRPKWDWYIDYAYHHWFTNDEEILTLAREIGFGKVLTKRPQTASVYHAVDSAKDQNTNEIYTSLFGKSTATYKLDTPLDLLKFNRISLFDRLRTGTTLATLRYAPKMPFYDTIKAKSYLTRTMGKDSYNSLWEPLFNKKFGRYKNDINMSFFWARVNKRTTNLAYPAGGFQAFADFFVNVVRKQGVKVVFNAQINKLSKKNSGFLVSLDTENYYFDVLINTLQTPLFLKIQNGLLEEKYEKRLSKIQYLGAQTQIFEMTEKVLPTTYWLNIALENNPWMVAIQHTNFMDKKHFDNHDIFYLATYTEKPVPEQQIDDKHVVWNKSAFIPMAQPLYTTDFIHIMPHVVTPTPGLYFANMELTYPYDRGTNYAIKVGTLAAEKIIES